MCEFLSTVLIWTQLNWLFCVTDAPGGQFALGWPPGVIMHILLHYAHCATLGYIVHIVPYCATLCILCVIVLHYAHCASLCYIMHIVLHYAHCASLSYIMHIAVHYATLFILCFNMLHYAHFAKREILLKGVANKLLKISSVSHMAKLTKILKTPSIP